MIPQFGNVQSHGSRMLPWLTFALLLIGSAVYAFGGPAPLALVFDRQAITAGEPWRLFTCHWVHADLEHLFWNLLTLVVLGWMIEKSLGRLTLISALLAGICVVTAGVWWFMPGLDYYCGLSGVLNTLLFVMLFCGWRGSGSYIFPLVAVGATVKIGFELFQSSAVFTDTSWPAVPEAHLAGALAAVIAMFYRDREFG